MVYINGSGGFAFVLKNSYLCFKPEPVSLELPIISASLLNEFPVSLEGSDMASRSTESVPYNQISPDQPSTSQRFLPPKAQPADPINSRDATCMQSSESDVWQKSEANHLG